jgi:hypothetical protein
MLQHMPSGRVLANLRAGAMAVNVAKQFLASDLRQLPRLGVNALALAAK